MLTLSELKKQVDELALKIKVPLKYLPTYGGSHDFAHLHLEVDDAAYHYVVVERGSEQERLTSKKLDDILYKLFDWITSCMAHEYSNKNTMQNQQWQQVYCQKKLELLKKVNLEWQQRYKAEDSKFLKEYYLDDTPTKPFSIEQIKNEIEIYAQHIKAPKSFLPTYGQDCIKGKPHIGLNNDSHSEEPYLYTIEEEGKQPETNKMVNLDDLLYKTFDHITLLMAQDYERKHRKKYPDPRRLIDQKRLELIKKISSNWAFAKKKEIEWAAYLNPYQDTKEPWFYKILQWLGFY